jgi:hypothetical protein
MTRQVIYGRKIPLLPFNFLINRVEYVLSDNGRSTVLSFVPPTAYTKGEIVDPWKI